MIHKVNLGTTNASTGTIFSAEGLLEQPSNLLRRKYQLFIKKCFFLVLHKYLSSEIMMFETQSNTKCETSPGKDSKP